MACRTLHDGPAIFDVTILEATSPARAVLFAAGRGGDPGRHLPLLESLAESGCSVVAPHFEMMAPIPAPKDLELRAHRLRLALECAPEPRLPVAGVGHSIGATLLLGLAGARLWTDPGQPLDIEPCGRLDWLVLLAPPLDFIRAPGALDRLRSAILAWAGTLDTFAPASGVEFLREAIDDRVPVELRVVEGAGHFSFMHLPPPQVPEPLADRDAFLNGLGFEIRAFLGDHKS